MSEPKIVINDRSLNEGQLLTLRLALGCLKLDLHEHHPNHKVHNLSVGEHLKHIDELTALIGGLST